MLMVPAAGMSRGVSSAGLLIFAQEPEIPSPESRVAAPWIGLVAQPQGPGQGFGSDRRYFTNAAMPSIRVTTMRTPRTAMPVIIMLMLSFIMFDSRSTIHRPACLAGVAMLPVNVWSRMDPIPKRGRKAPLGIGAAATVSPLASGR